MVLSIALRDAFSIEKMETLCDLLLNLTLLMV
jgi:hypothetical protein